MRDMNVAAPLYQRAVSSGADHALEMQEECAILDSAPMSQTDPRLARAFAQFTFLLTVLGKVNDL